VTIDNPYLVVGAEDGGLVSLGAVADTAASNTPGAWSVIALLKGILAKLFSSIQTSVSNFPPVQPVSGSVSVGNFPAVQLVSFLTGRQQVALVWERMPSSTLESVPSSFTSGTRGGVNISSAASYTVSAGKTFRIQSVSVLVRVAVAKSDLNSRVRIRNGLSNTSPIIWQGEAATSQPASFVESGAGLVFPIPEGLEIPAGQSIVVTHLDSSTNGTISVDVIGFEY
jgi:hypothetical protein